MATKYTKKFTKPYAGGYKDKPDKTTPVTADILNMQDDTFEAIEDYLANLEIDATLPDNVEINNSLRVGAKPSGATAGTFSLANGMQCTASGNYSHAEGYMTSSSGASSHAEGVNTKATDQGAHAEGVSTEASGSIASHAEGNGTKATQAMAHAEGYNTVASGAGSHAEGSGTKASGQFQHVQGICNIEDTEGKYAHIVGGGTSDTDRKNIFTLDWNGNAEFAGDVKAKGDISLSEQSKKIDSLSQDINTIKNNISDSVPQTRTINKKALNKDIDLSAEDVGAIDTSLKGSKNGVAELDENGLVPSSQLPSYVDDVLEYDTKSDFPASGESGKIYIDTATNLQYRWSGSQYVEISASIALGETSSTAYRGDRGKEAYEHSQLKSGNPHNVTKKDIGLDNVPNVSTNDQTPTFSQSTERTLPASGEKLSVLFGKIVKWLSDLKAVAFSGSYNDLTDKPTVDSALSNTSTNAVQNIAINAALNTKLATTGDGSDVTTVFSEAESLDELTTGEKLSASMGKLKLAVKNLKTLISLIGTTDISEIGDGTVTGGLASVNSKLSQDNIQGLHCYTCGNNDVLTFDIFSTYKGCVLFFKRNTTCFAIAMDYWASGYTILSGTVPSAITITKDANTTRFLVKNTMGVGVAVMFVGCYLP